MNAYTEKNEFTGARVPMPVCCRTLTGELSEEFTLPDYLSEIRKLLSVKARLLPPAKYIGADKIEYNGQAEYTILYVGPDGGLYSAELHGEYDGTAPFDLPASEIGEEIVCYALPEVESLLCRVTAPRKVSIRTRMRVGVRAFAVCELGEEVRGASEGVHRLSRVCDSLWVVHGMSERREYSAEIEVSGGEALRVIAREASVFVQECRAMEGGALCRGEILLRVWVCPEGEESAVGRPQALLRKIPFEETVELEGMDASFAACGVGLCDGVRVEVSEGLLLCEVGLVCEVTGQCDRSVTLSEDLFSSTHEGSCRYRELSIPHALAALNGNMSLSEAVEAEGALAAAEVVEVSAVAKIAEVKCERGRGVAVGECVYTVIGDCEGEYASAEYALPFRYEFECGGEIADYDAVAVPVSLKARRDGDRIRLDTELSIALRVSGEEVCRVVAEAAFEEPIAAARGGFTVCYPAESDTLWQVAKRYHADPARTAARNHLPASGSLAGVKFLIV